jgi:predicted nucleic acid-binding protein
VSATTFVDTSILVWTQDSQDARSQARALERLKVETVTGLPTISTNVLGEYYIALTKRRGREPLMSREEAAERVRMAAHFNVIGVQKEHVLDALRLRDRHQLQFWDALNLATARAAGCTLLLTADAQSAKVIEGVRFENPIG